MSADEDDTGIGISEPEEPEELAAARRLRSMLYRYCGGDVDKLDEVERDLLDSLDAFIRSFESSDPGPELEIIQ